MMTPDRADLPPSPDDLRSVADPRPAPLATESTHWVHVCQGKSCRKLGAAQVLAAFQAQPHCPVPIVPGSCLGQCGNGPMVVVLPEKTWYCRVSPAEVPAIVDRHLHQGQPIPAMLYPKFHPPCPH